MVAPMASLSQHQIYVFATSLMAAFFIAAMIRLWLLRRVEEQLLKNKAALEKQIIIQQKDLMTVRQESNAWRTEMQRQFDLFRHTASTQLGVEEKRFNDLMSKSTRREYELLTALDIAKQMCADLPSTQARVLHLESLLSGSPSATPSAPAPSSDDSQDGGQPAPAPAPVSPMPDLGGSGLAAPVEEPTEAPKAPLPPRPFTFPSFFSTTPPPPPTPESAEAGSDVKLQELEDKLAEAEKKNASLQVALTTTRLKARTQLNPLRKHAAKKRRPLPKVMA